jgi:hypothetical protein
VPVVRRGTIFRSSRAMTHATVNLALFALVVSCSNAENSYSRSMGVVPFRTHLIRNVSVGSNHSLAPCMLECDAEQSCQGFSVDSWACVRSAVCLQSAQPYSTAGGGVV